MEPSQTMNPSDTTVLPIKVENASSPNAPVKTEAAPRKTGSVLTAASALTTMGGPAGSPGDTLNTSTASPTTSADPPAQTGASETNGSKDFDDDIPMTFPQRLMDVLSNEAHQDVITWLPHGKGFIIYKKKKFAVEVLPKYFKQAKFTSFTRKLNRWGFSRITRGPETGAYYHRYFQRGNLRLCLQMSCQSVKGANSGVQDPFAAMRGIQPDPLRGDVAFPSITSQSASFAAQENLLRQLQIQQQQQQLDLLKQQMTPMGFPPMQMQPYGGIGLTNPAGMYFEMLNNSKGAANGFNPQGLNPQGLNPQAMAMNPQGMVPGAAGQPQQQQQQHQQGQADQNVAGPAQQQQVQPQPQQQIPQHPPQQQMSQQQPQMQQPTFNPPRASAA